PFFAFLPPTLRPLEGAPGSGAADFGSVASVAAVLAAAVAGAFSEADFEAGLVDASAFAFGAGLGFGGGASELPVVRLRNTSSRRPVSTRISSTSTPRSRVASPIDVAID